MDMMQTNREASNVTMENAKRAQASLSNLIVRKFGSMNTQIATATEEQTLVAGEINQSIVDVNDNQSLKHTTCRHQTRESLGTDSAVWKAHASSQYL